MWIHVINVSKHEFDLKMTKKMFHCGGSTFEKFIANHKNKNHCCIRTQNLWVSRPELS